MIKYFKKLILRTLFRKDSILKDVNIEGSFHVGFIHNHLFFINSKMDLKEAKYDKDTRFNLCKN